MNSSAINLFPSILSIIGEPLPPIIDFMVTTLHFSLVVSIATTVYFLPTFFALNKKYLTGIFIINLTLGWTVLGWVGALVWAVSAPKK